MIKVQVIEADISLGCQGDNMRCPVANAANRSFGLVGNGVAVGPDTIRRFDTGEVFKLPGFVRDWIRRYDETVITGEVMETIEFEI